VKCNLQFIIGERRIHPQKIACIGLRGGEGGGRAKGKTESINHLLNLGVLKTIVRIGVGGGVNLRLRMSICQISAVGVK